ncbi:MAG: hypothetical protein A2428_10060 [Bdellovibrionales bacterium RIFOXYC1_FULL_54_43]|nr:MAG: hypothetical protein A2428_10060 [Bdellovibrionales bacterium RIFOXYC1_FULL_54_43]OFZ80527.1 MAG: hypothetical protein A2603_13155 [Bdellovibrionales bacterium RIFOXYD1_FULL_55_31]
MIDPKRIEKIYFTLAAAKGSGRSSFGHAYLRISESDEPSLDDKVIEFVAHGEIDSVGKYLRALGIGQALDRDISVAPYSTIIQEMNFRQLRALTNYELRLTPAQRATVVHQINKHLRAGKFGKYNFFTQNCASAVTDILKSAGISVGYGFTNLTPESIPKALEKRGMIVSRTEDLALDMRRSNLFEKYENDLRESLPEIDSIKAGLISKSQSERIYSFSYILSHIRERPLPSKVNSYLSAFKFLERRVIRSDLNRALKGERAIADLAFPVHRTSLTGLDETERWKIETSELEVKDNNGKLTLAAVFRVQLQSRHQHEKRIRVTFPLTDFHVNERGEVIWQGIRVGFKTEKKLHGSEFVFDGVSFLPEFLNDKSERLLVKMRMLVNNAPVRQTKITSMDSAEMIPLRNDDPERPSCYGFVNLQKALLQNTLFDPFLAPLSPAESLALVADALKGKSIIVPGFKDARSWLSSLDPKAVRNVIHEYSRDKYGSVVGAVSNYFNSSKVTSEALLRIGVLARSGIYTPIFQRVSGAEGHAVLVLDVIDEGKRARVVAYDPNLGYVRDLFFFDKATEKLQSTVYSEEKIFAPTLDVNQELFVGKLQGPDSSNLLLELSRISGRHSFSTSELSSVY